MSLPIVETATKQVGERALMDLCADCYDDPLGFVLQAYDWPINGEPGPDRWQAGVLEELGRQIQDRAFDGVHPVLPIRQSISSGHGAGKTALLAWIVDFLMSTRPNAQGSVTANTASQLEFKTWAAIQRWTALCLTGRWFTVNSTIMYRTGHRADWFCVPLPNKEHQSDAFQGQHAKTSTSFYIVDEASGIGPSIAQVIEGGLTDGEPWVIASGNMLRNNGWFYETVFGKLRHRWQPAVVDTRTTKFADKDGLIRQWAEDYGEDSDFFRVRVRGLPPRASELQYIDKARVDDARSRTQPHLPSDPLVAGMDVADGGASWNVIRFRRGLNGRVRPPIRIPGSADADRSKRIGICAELLEDSRPESQLAMLFVDSAFGAPIVQALKLMGYDNVMEIRFGGESPDPHDENMRAYMYHQAKEWLLYGSIPDEDRLCDQAGLAGFHLNKSGRLVIESKADIKARGELSPDDWDAFCLTFAQKVARRRPRVERRPGPQMGLGEKAPWMGV